MKREIKFRAWSKETEKMMQWADICRFKNFNKLLTLTHVEVMQFTGLHDKNGKEIYEGDVVEVSGVGQSKSNLYYEVIWKDCAFLLKDCAFHLKYWGPLSRLPEAAQKLSFSYEVVGNIYQNPELITLKD